MPPVHQLRSPRLTECYTHAEIVLLGCLLGALALAAFGPAVAQYANYHAFADQRGAWGVPHAVDVLSNLPFALAGVLGLFGVWKQRAVAQVDARWQLITLFFAGLLVTAVCSGYYHWRPDNAGLAVDRCGMVVAFAGLLGAAVADRVGVRMGWVVAGLVLFAGPASALVSLYSGNLLPWAVLQGGGVLLVLCLALRAPVPGAWRLPLLSVIAWYALAKILELNDHHVFAWTQGLVSGHSLKHVAAALAAWPVLSVMHNGAQNQNRKALPQAV
ncbi:MAG: hypothetical protein U5M53_10030 [Rhodoferax sp.]|nr:hypothetical protein [Rhodoferax sp.]